jgi:carboxypeptidase T
MFAYDSFGSTGEEDVCSEMYRGPFPFSEPETAAIRDFVGNWTNIKVAINLHAYGNLYITPFNFDNKQNTLLRS